MKENGHRQRRMELQVNNKPLSIADKKAIRLHAANSEAPNKRKPNGALSGKWGNGGYLTNSKLR